MTKSINVLNPEFFKKKIEPLKLNLQYFSEEDPPSDPPTDPPEDPPAKLELTQEELDKKIEAEADRKLTKSLEKKKVEWEQEKKKIEADAKKTAEEYAKLTAKEKEDTDYQKRIESLDKREQELNNKQLLSEVEADVKKSGFPASFAKALISIQDNQEIKTVISDLKKEWDEQQKEAVKESLRQEPPENSQSFTDKQSSGNKSRAEMARESRIIK